MDKHLEVNANSKIATNSKGDNSTLVAKDSPDDFLTQSGTKETLVVVDNPDDFVKTEKMATKSR